MQTMNPNGMSEKGLSEKEAELKKNFRGWFCPACRCPVSDEDSFCPYCETGKPPVGWPADLYIGRIIGKKYRIEKRISSGGFGIIFLATHIHQQIEMGKVIIKMLHPEHNFDPVLKKRFINEAKAARSIQNPHVVKVFDLDFDVGMVPYMVQEYVEGETLSSLIVQKGKIPITRAVTIALQVAEGMKEAHAKGILHRDLKPENIIVQNSEGADFVKIIDFGIARFERQSSIATASFIGTPRYMSPEQIRGGAVDARSDIFSMGVILFEMLTGEPPIISEGSEIEYLNLNLEKEPRKLLDIDSNLPPAISDLVDRMLKKNPEQRPQDFGTVINELNDIAESLGWKADHTGSYRVAKESNEQTLTATVPDNPPVNSIHSATTEKLLRPRQTKSMFPFLVFTIIITVSIVTTAIILLALFLFEQNGVNSLKNIEGVGKLVSKEMVHKFKELQRIGDKSAFKNPETQTHPPVLKTPGELSQSRDKEGTGVPETKVVLKPFDEPKKTIKNSSREKLPELQKKNAQVSGQGKARNGKGTGKSGGSAGKSGVEKEWEKI